MSKVRLQGLTVDQMKVIADRLQKVGAIAAETDLALYIADEVEYCLNTGKHTESITTITRSIAKNAWPAGANRLGEKFKKRIVRVALALLEASYNRTDHTFKWQRTKCAESHARPGDNVKEAV